MIAGALPALLIFFIRLFVPESHKWEAQRDAGGASHWATRDLIGVLVGALGAGLVIFLWSPTFEALVRVTPADGEAFIPDLARIGRLIGTLLGPVVALLGYMYPVVQYLRRAEGAGRLTAADRVQNIRRMLFGACLAGVALLGTWGSLQWAPKWAIALAATLPEEAARYAKEYTQIATACGAVVGTILAALMGGWLGRRITYALLCVGSFVSIVYMYQANDAFGGKFLVSAFVAGGVSAAFYGWFPLYLPELFPTSIRATSQGFAYNFGRVLSAIGSLHTATLMAYFSAGFPPERASVDGLAKSCASLAAIYLIGAVIIWLGPETKGQPLPE